MSLEKKDITIGCDPEFFLFDSETYRHISAHGLVPGDKKNPYKLKKGAVQLDGTAVEFNINPTNDPQEFKENILSVLSEIREMIPKKYRFSFVPAVFYESKYFNSIPPECLILGCEPDFASTTGVVKSMPVIPERSENFRMRTGAGHIHVGWTNGVKDYATGNHFKEARYLADNFRRVIEGYNVEGLWEPGGNKRKILYGAEGAFRPKPYGMEFRSPSNAWLNYPELYPFICALSQEIVMQCYRNGSTHMMCIPYFYSQVNGLGKETPITYSNKTSLGDMSRHLYLKNFNANDIYKNKLEM